MTLTVPFLTFSVWRELSEFKTHPKRNSRMMVRSFNINYWVKPSNCTQLTCRWIPRCTEHTDARKCARPWSKASGDLEFIDGITSLPPHMSAPRDGSDGGSRSIPERFLPRRQELNLYRTRTSSYSLLVLLHYISQNSDVPRLRHPSHHLLTMKTQV